MAYAVQIDPMMRYTIGDYQIVWLQSRHKDACTGHRNQEKRQVGRFTIPSEWQNGEDPVASQAWRAAPNNRSGAALCRRCATFQIEHFARALAAIAQADA